MSTELDKRLVPQVKSLMERLGKVLTFVEEFVKEDNAAGTTEKVNEIKHQVKCSPPEGVTVHELSGDDVQMGDLKTVVPADGLDFKLKDKMPVEFDDETWRIVFIKPVRTGEDIALYEIRMRR